MFKLEKKKDKAVLTIHGYVGGYYMRSEHVARVLDQIRAEKLDKLDVHIHTFGGSVFEGNLIKNFFASYEGYLTILIDGVAASMGAILMLPADRIEIVSDGYIMTHEPSGGVYGTCDDMESSANLLRSMRKAFVAQLMERTGQSEEEVTKWVSKTDRWFSAEEALKLGLVDGIFKAKAVKKVPKKEELTDMGARAVYELYTPEAVINDDAMDKVKLIEKFGLTGVTAESTDEEVTAAIEAKMNAQKTEADAGEEAQKEAIEAIVDAAVDSGKIDKSKRGDWVSRGEMLGAKELRAMFADMKAYKPITGQLGGKGGDGGKDEARAGWTWDDWQAKAPKDLEALRENDFEAFAKIYEAEFGVKPEQ